MQLTQGPSLIARHNDAPLRESQETVSTQISLRPAITRSDESKATCAQRQIFPWKVIHACEQVRDVLSVVEAQLSVGMRPFLLTPTGFGSGLSYLRRPLREKMESVSLLQAWNDVRNWKRLLAECDSQNHAEILHTHCFAAGMAAVRSEAAVVYDLLQPIEQIGAEEKSWLRRSFHVAEQFVMARAAALVVHSRELREECLRRGIEKDDLFLVPRPLDSTWLDSIPNRRWIEQRTGAQPGTTIFFVPQLAAETSERERQVSSIMAGLIFAHREKSNVKLVLLENGYATAIRETLQAEVARDLVQVLPQKERDLIFASCDVAVLWENSDYDLGSSLFAEALGRGRALLAQKSSLGDDMPAASCLRFGSEKELSYRMAFLARNPDVCRMMATNGWRHLVDTRSPQAIGRCYDEVYNHVAAKRKQKETKSKDVRLVPLHVNL